MRVRCLGQVICGAGNRPADDAADGTDERLDVIQIRTIGTLAEVVIAALLEEECGSQLVKVVRKGSIVPVPRPGPVAYLPDRVNITDAVVRVVGESKLSYVRPPRSAAWRHWDRLFIHLPQCGAGLSETHTFRRHGPLSGLPGRLEFVAQDVDKTYGEFQMTSGCPRAWLRRGTCSLPLPSRRASSSRQPLFCLCHLHLGSFRCPLSARR